MEPKPNSKNEKTKRATKERTTHILRNYVRHVKREFVHISSKKIVKKSQNLRRVMNVRFRRKLREEQREEGDDAYYMINT